MTITNVFWKPPTVVAVPDCCSNTTPPPVPPNLSIGSQPGLNINTYVRTGDYVVAQTPGPGGTTIQTLGFVDNISADGTTTVIADGETGTTTNVNTRFISFYAPVQTVNQYPGQSIGFNNNFYAPVYAVNQYSRGAFYRSQFLASTRALRGVLTTTQ